MSKNIFLPVIDVIKVLLSHEAPLLETGLPPIEKHPYALKGRQILPPYLGEMGLEIRGFLGQVEPWIRSGWMIPARRPALYPKESVFEDPVFFDYLAALRQCDNVPEMCGQLFKTFNDLGLTYGISYKDDQLDLEISSNNLKDVLKAASFEKTLRKIVVDRYMHNKSVPTPWAYPLTGIFQPSSAERAALYFSSRGAQCPTYQPESFARPFARIGKHIGVQVRNLPGNPDKNSNISRMSQVAELAARLSGLPVAVYGKPNDMGLPGRPRTLDVIPPEADFLGYELSFLSECALMISPDSGWCDLMCWLRVPTLLEQQCFPFGYEGLRAMRPRLLLLDPLEDAWAGQITTLLNTNTNTVLMPDPMQTTQPYNNIDLNPGGAECAQWWSDFMA